MTDAPLDFGDPGDLAGTRDAFRSWLAANPLPVRGDDEPEALYLHRWHRQLYGGGWVGLDVPVEYGGRGQTALEQIVVSDELGAAGAPGVPRVGYLAHAIFEFGTEEQRRELLPKMLSGEDTWCQGFSEPGAGSDLASMTTTAVLEGDVYVTRGQKLWTSYGQYSSTCLLLARTNHEGPRHATISAFALRLDSPGVTVRPVRAANGDDEFCEVFLDDVRIPIADRIGDEGIGWPLAMLTISYERNAVDTGHLSKYGRVNSELRQLARERRDVLPDGVTRDIGRCTVEYEVLAAHARRRIAERHGGQVAGHEASVDKLLMTMAEQNLYETIVSVLAEDVLVGDTELFHAYLYARAASVYGGTSQIQRNILAKQVLRLPSARASASGR